MTIAPTSGGGSTHNIDGTLEVIAILALVALLAGLTGLYMTRNRALPVAVAGVDQAGAPPVNPPTSGLYTPPPADADHDWTSQTPGPPPPPPPPPAPGEETP